MEYRSLNDMAVEIREDGDSKTITGYAAVYDSLSHNLGGFRETIKRGAFDRSIKEVSEGKRTVRARIQHDGGLNVVGTTSNGSLRLSSDSTGLKYEIVSPPNTQAGRDIVELVKGGYINKSSFAFMSNGTKMKWDHSTSPPTVELLDIDLIDVAPVDGPAYEATSVAMRSIMVNEMNLTKPMARGSRIEKRELDNGRQHVEIYILDVIMPTWLSRYMTDTISSGEVIEALQETPDAERIDVFINSPGGEVFEANAIYQTLKDHKAPVNIFIRGLASSAAGIIAMAGDNIQIAEGGFLMVHNSWSATMGNAAALRRQAALLDKIDDSMAGILARRSNNDPKQVAKWMDAETWFTAEESVKYGFADRIGGTIEEETDNGERCRNLGYRNIPTQLGGPSIPISAATMSAEEMREVNNKLMKRLR